MRELCSRAYLRQTASQEDTIFIINPHPNIPVGGPTEGFWGTKIIMGTISCGGLDSNHLNGSVGSHTFRYSKGQLIVSQKAVDHTDARTYEQVAQRAKWMNVVAIAKSMTSSAFKFGFEDKAQNQTDFNLFYKYALSLEPAIYITKAMREAGVFVPAPYPITKGSLGTIQNAYDATNGCIATDLTYGAAIDENTTVAEFSVALKNANSGWQMGDKLIYVVLVGEMGSDGYVRYKTIGASVMLSDSDTAKVLSLMPRMKVIDGKIAVEAGEYDCGAFIHQRNVDSVIKVSNQDIVVSDAAALIAAEYQTEAAKEDAMNSLGGWNDSLIGSKASTSLADGTVTRGESGDTPEPTVTYTLKLTAGNHGTVDPAGETTHAAGEEVEIKAIPNSGYNFKEWSDGDDNATRTITMDKDYDLTATFENQ